jgi:hypothetical protein
MPARITTEIMIMILIPTSHLVHSGKSQALKKEKEKIENYHCNPQFRKALLLFLSLLMVEYRRGSMLVIIKKVDYQILETLVTP